MGRLATLLILCLALACGGGGGGTSQPQGGVPVLSDLQLNPNTAVQNAGGGSISTLLTFKFSDSDGDITTVRIISGGQSQDSPITGLTGITSGGIQGTLTLRTTTQGIFSFQISVLDAKSNQSNILTGEFIVTPPPPALTSLSPQTVAAGGPAFNLTVQGDRFFPDSVVTWNGVPRPTTYVSPTMLQAAIASQDISLASTVLIRVQNPVAEGGNSAALPLYVSALSTQVVPTPANDLVWDRATGHLYASTPSTAGSNGNSILVIDPTTGTVLRSVFAGSEPNQLAISGDGQFLYVSLDGSGAIKRFLLPGLTEDLSIPLGSSPYFGPYFALDLQVAPGSPHTLAVSLGCKSVSPSAQGGVVIFDDATPRPVKANGGFNLMDSIQWGADANHLYAANTESTGFDFFLLSVDATGVTVTSDLSSTFTSFMNAIHYDPSTNLIYSGSGQVLDPLNGRLMGTFPARGAMVPVGSRQTAYFLYQDPLLSNAFTLAPYDLARFTPMTPMAVPWPSSSASYPMAPNRLIEWGPGSLASAGRGNPINIYSFPPASTTPPAPAITAISPATALPGGSGFTLTLQGSQFFPDSAVYWNGAPRTTTYLSGTSLQAAIPAQDLAAAKSVPVFVQNPASEGGASAKVVFSVSSIPIVVVGQTANDLAWDAIHGVIYASVPSSVGRDGNVILVIDPTIGTVIRSVSAGSEPNRLAISGDGQFLYVSLDGSGTIKRFLLPGLTEDLSIPLGSSPYYGPYFALDLQVAPGSPHTLAVSLGCKSVSPRAQGGVVIFDDATPRPVKAKGGFNLMDSIQWGADANHLYAANTESTGFDFFLLSVDATGVTVTSDLSSTFTSFVNAIHYDPSTNLIYSGSGQVLDPLNGRLMGTFPAGGAMVPAPTLNAACFLSQNPATTGFYSLASYHLTRFTPLATAQIPWPAGSTFLTAPNRLVQWGTNGLASCGAGNPLNIYGAASLGGLAAGGGALRPTSLAIDPQKPIARSIHPAGLLIGTPQFSNSSSTPIVPVGDTPRR